MLPHEHIEAYVVDRLGRRARRLGPLVEDLFEGLITVVVDHLSAYEAAETSSALVLGAVTLRERDGRTHLLAQLRDRGGNLREREALEGYLDDGHTDDEFAEAVCARRWRFVERYLGGLLTPLIDRVGDVVVAYYQRRPGAVLNASCTRLLAGVDASYLCVDFDDRRPDRTHDRPADWSVA